MTAPDDDLDPDDMCRICDRCEKPIEWDCDRYMPNGDNVCPDCVTDEERAMALCFCGSANNTEDPEDPDILICNDCGEVFDRPDPDDD